MRCTWASASAGSVWRVGAMKSGMRGMPPLSTSCGGGCGARPDNRAMSSQENPAGTDFSVLALSPAMLSNLQRLGYRQMTPIQAACLPGALAGPDLMAQARTGRGQRGALALGPPGKLDPRRLALQALVLCPTRELAEQVGSEIRRLARAEENTRLVTLCGGVPLRGQMLSLAHGAHIVVGTPG